MADLPPVDYLRKTLIGKLKIASAVLGVLLIVFVAVGHDSRQSLRRACEGPSFQEGILDSPLHVALINGFMAVFVAFTLLVPFIPPVWSESIYPQIDSNGHLALAIIQCISATSYLAYTVNVSLISCQSDGYYITVSMISFIIATALGYSHAVVCFHINIKVANQISLEVEPQREVISS